ncbi:Protein of uncharacterised function (DUF3494) [Legionella busanensis]|uniref:Protein of uncharacterized function (DUF3494) n=1 Tax=Legionella busanensis TaxID=190655 RepID=A0A378JKJ8_9GAMM|nr:ice-binding family protein [Legionella busanensis]STX50843.1 Protein of uncharacterised function (DUF3494) [Legionella busanensis]
MLKKISYGIALCSLMLPLMSQAKSEELACEKNASLVQDVTFTQVPTFNPVMTTFTVQTGVYTLRNNTRATIGLRDISVVPVAGDTLPPGTAFIDSTVPNACGAFLAPFASCNIRVVVYPVLPGYYNRLLHVGINSRQCSLNSPISTVAVTPIVEPVLPGIAFIQPYYTCLINAQAAVSSANEGGPSVVSGAVCSNAEVNGFPIGVAAQVNEGAPIASADLENAALANTFLRGLCPEFPIAGPITGVFTPGVYCLSSSELSGQVVLSGPGSYFFVTEAGLATADGSQIVLVNGAIANNIFFSTSGQTTLGNNSLFQGNLINEQSNLRIGTGVTIVGSVKNLGANLTIRRVTAIAP